MPNLPLLTVEALKVAAGDYAKLLSATPILELYGVTDGKAIGTHVEAGFNAHINLHFTNAQGNAAKGIDFPQLDVDLKVTSVTQPQSSSPFRDATQKVYGLGYSLLVFVYAKTDDADLKAARLQIQHVVFVDASATADFQTTSGLQRIFDNAGNVDDIDAFLQERNLPLDDIGRRSLAKRILHDRPAIGCLTISNALQWRLQYNRAIQLAAAAGTPGVEDLRAE